MLAFILKVKIKVVCQCPWGSAHGYSPKSSRDLFDFFVYCKGPLYKEEDTSISMCQRSKIDLYVKRNPFSLSFSFCFRFTLAYLFPTNSRSTVKRNSYSVLKEYSMLIDTKEDISLWSIIKLFCLFSSTLPSSFFYFIFAILSLAFLSEIFRKTLICDSVYKAYHVC